MKILFAWLGRTDLMASKGDVNAGLGPIGQAVSNLQFDEILLLSNLQKADDSVYIPWLREITTAKVSLERVELTDPTDFREIYEGARRAIEKRLCEDRGHQITFHLSPGTPSMASVWIILAKTRYPAQLIQSSLEKGVRIVSLPFDISAEYIPDLLASVDTRLEAMANESHSAVTGFGNLLYQSTSMEKVVDLARRIALHRVPVLIEGETGTGKEVFARSIHAVGPRKNKPLVIVNCGAIPEQLVESELFGHKRGAFSGADRDRLGHFVEANGGTIFLDEVGELPLAAQVKLLRVLQENEVMPVGSSKVRKVDVRVISATNRSLLGEIGKGTFREDLFYRLAVFVLTLPALRNREGDLNLLVNAKLERINEENAGEIWAEPKELSPGARNILFRHSWPGNVRELEHTLLRAAVISNGNMITAADIESAIFAVSKVSDGLLEMPLGNGFDVRELISDVKRHYLARALREANNNKSEAAELLGLPNYQTLTNWLSSQGMRS